MCYSHGFEELASASSGYGNHFKPHVYIFMKDKSTQWYDREMLGGLKLQHRKK